MAPNGQSFVTAVALKQRPVMLRNSGGERQISLEGYAYSPEIHTGRQEAALPDLKGTSARTPSQECQFLGS